MDSSICIDGLDKLYREYIKRGFEIEDYQGVWWIKLKRPVDENLAPDDNNIYAKISASTDNEVNVELVFPELVLDEYNIESMKGDGYNEWKIFNHRAHLKYKMIDGEPVLIERKIDPYLKFGKRFE